MKTTKSRAANGLLYLILCGGVILMVFPFLWMILSAFKSVQEVNAVPPTFFPQTWTPENFGRVWRKLNFALYFKNSISVTLICVGSQVYTSALLGYIFGKLRFRGKEVIFWLFVAAMMIPFSVLMVPLYQEMVWLNLVGKLTAVIGTNLLSLFGIFMMRQFMQGVPDELIEAAEIDGAAHFKIFHRIVFPLLKPALSALCILQFLWVWNDFLWPFLMLNDPLKYTLSVAFTIFSGQYYIDYASVMTGASIAVIPVLVVYFIFQKQFVEGVALSSLKG